MTKKAPTQKPPATAAAPHVVERQMVDSYLRAIALNDTAEEVADILMLVDNPLVDVQTNDAISMIFHRFYKHTPAHPALPIFTFLSMLSAWCVKSKATCQIPMMDTPAELDTWVMLLSDTGAMKSLSAAIITRAMPLNPITGRPLIESNFVLPVSNGSYVQQLADLPDHRGFWKQDEASQFIKLVDATTGPLAGVNGSMLITKDHGNIGYGTKDNPASVDGPVLTVLMINTIKAMIGAISEESMNNGMFRRFTTAWAGRDSFDGSKPFAETALINMKAVNDDVLQGELAAIFTQSIEGNAYTFSHPCTRLYTSTFKTFWERQYSRFLSNHEVYFRTYMMESWRYAVFHHILHKKPGLVVDEYSLQWGLKVSMYLLNSLQQFINAQANRAEVPNVKQKIDKFMDFIRANEGKPYFGMREISRKFTMKKEEIFGMLRSIKVHDPKFKTSLFELLKEADATPAKCPRGNKKGA